MVRFNSIHTNDSIKIWIENFQHKYWTSSQKCAACASIGFFQLHRNWNQNEKCRIHGMNNNFENAKMLSYFHWTSFLFTVNSTKSFRMIILYIIPFHFSILTLVTKPSIDLIFSWNFEYERMPDKIHQIFTCNSIETAKVVSTFHQSISKLCNTCNRR